MAFFDSTLRGMGIKNNSSTQDLYGTQSPGGSDSSSYRGMSDQGREFASTLRGTLLGNPYQAFQGARPTMELNSLGLTQGQDLGFRSAIEQALGQQSAQFSMRGLNNPKDLGAIAGSAAQNVMPQFAPLMSQNLNDQFSQQMANQQFGAGLETNRLNQALNLLQNYQEQTSKSAQRGSGQDYNATKTATDNWYSMWNKIGSSWGSAGAGGAGAM